MTGPEHTAHDAAPPEVPVWKLERYALGELPAAETERLRQRLAADADLRGRLQALSADDAQIRGRYPAAWMARQIRERAGAAPARRSPSWGRWSWSLVPAAAVALLAVVALPGGRDGADAPPRLAMTQTLADGVRIKGDGPSLFVHRRTADGTERLDDGGPARAGDLLRLQYAADGATYGAILSIDGRGVVTRHLPVAGDDAAPLATGTVSLESAYELDDAPRWERFYLIASDAPFALDEVLRAAERAGRAESPPARLDLSEELAQAGLTVTKVGGAGDGEADR